MVGSCTVRVEGEPLRIPPRSPHPSLVVPDDVGVEAVRPLDVGEPVLEAGPELAAAFQVVLFADEGSHQCLKLEGFTRVGVVGGDFGGEVDEVVHGAAYGAHPLAAVRHGGHAGHFVHGADVAGQFEECPAQHDVGVVVGHFLVHRFGCRPLGGELGGVRLTFRCVEDVLLDHAADGAPDHVGFVHAGPRFGGCVEPSTKGGEAFFVVERLEAAFEGVHGVVVRFPEWNLAPEGAGVADCPVVADESLQHEVVDGFPVAVDGGFGDVLVAELVAADRHVVHVGRAVPALEHAFFVVDFFVVTAEAGDCEAADEFAGGLVFQEGAGGVADGEQEVASVFALLHGVAEAVLATCSEDVGEAGEDFGVAVELEELEAEAVGAVVGTEAGPEALGRDGTGAVDFDEVDFPLVLAHDVKIADSGFPILHVSYCGRHFGFSRNRVG